MSDRTIYVYDESTGKIQYTVDEASDFQIENFKKKGVPVFATTKKYKILGTYVEKNANTGMATGIAPIRHMDFISVDKPVLVANGTDEVVISGLKNGVHVDINGEGSYTVYDGSGPTLELSANGFSYNQEHNVMTIGFTGYGYYASQVQIELIEGE